MRVMFRMVLREPKAVDRKYSERKGSGCDGIDGMGGGRIVTSHHVIPYIISLR